MNNLLKIQNFLKENNLDAFIVFHNDEYLNEYVASYADRLKWISHFSGSVGKAVIKRKSATIFVDGRYTIQAKEEVNKNLFAIKHLKDFKTWLKGNLNNKMTIGLDPRLLAKKDLILIEKIVHQVNSEVKFLTKNPIDKLWKNQPKKPNSNAFIHPVKYSGQSINKKISQIKSKLRINKCDYYILTALDSIAWILNLRGRDLPYTPVNLSYAIISKNKKIELFINRKKIKNVRSKLSRFVNFNSLISINNFFNNLPKNSIIGIDKSKTPYFFENIFKDRSIKFKYLEDPCLYPKAIKNKTELNGARKANIRDGVSVTKFLFWLKNLKDFSKLDEIKAAKKLLSLRKNNELFYSLSFETISALNKNSALPHYRVSKKSNLKFRNNSIYLVDSGAQYFDGTTDITRTIILGNPTKEQKDRFTRVLKGHIAIATSIFKKETKGSSLDPMARKNLLKIDCDYDHGTGHGIGSFLNVHEGPQLISKAKNLSEGKICDGMIMSNEPGFYKKNKYGIRVENLIIAKKTSNSLLKFETISWAPIEIELIELSLLTKKEFEWLNKYHHKVLSKLYSFLNKKEQIWLKKVTKPLKY